MSEMVERVAEAIAPGLRHYENCTGNPAELRRAAALKLARAAIEAMGVPTDAALWTAAEHIRREGGQVVLTENGQPAFQITVVALTPTTPQD
jgi:hypothetical protein